MTPEMAVTLALGFLGSSVLGGAVNAWFTRRKTTADATEVIGRAYQGALDALEERIKGLEAQLGAVETKLTLERERNDELWALVGQLRAEKDQLSEELKTERALTKRQQEKIGFLEARVQALEGQASH